MILRYTSLKFAAAFLTFAISVLTVASHTGSVHFASGGPETKLNPKSLQNPLKIANVPRSGGSESAESHHKDSAHFTVFRNAAGEMVCRTATAEEVRQRQSDTDRSGLRQLNHLELKEAGINKSEQAGTGLTIILRGTQQLQQNPTAQQAFVRAAANWEAVIMSPVTIYMDVDYGDTLFGQPWPPGVLGATSAPRRGHPYQSVRANIIAEADGEGNATKQAIFNALPSTTVPSDLGGSSSTTVADSTARAIGLLPATAQATDSAARIGFNSSFPFDFDPADGITGGQIDFDAVATHEIGHALGFISDAGRNLPRPAVWDLFRFRTGTTTETFPNAPRILTIGGSPDPLQFLFAPGNSELGLSTGGPGGSTANGGDGWQSSHWKHVSGCAGNIGLMSPAIPSGCRRTINSNDLLAASVFGYNLTNNVAPPPAPPPPPSPANDNFATAQVVIGCSGNVAGTTFGATSEVGEPSHDPLFTNSLSPGHTVWYQWQAPSSVSTTITTQGSEFDTLLAVYTGSSLGSLTRVAFNDDVQDGVSVTSSVSFRAMAGTTYKIAVDGWAGDKGGVKLNWNGCPAPTCPSALTVNDNGDGGDATPGDNVCATPGGACTLRAAIQEINALSSCDTIDINFSGVTGPISLNTTLPEIARDLRINGPGPGLLTIQRSNAANTPSFRVFIFGAGVAASISGVTISNGSISNAINGAGVLNRGTLTVTNAVITGNTAFPNGWAIYNESVLNVTNTSVTNNPGGGIGNGGTATVTASTISGNSNTIGGAGINSGGNLTVLNSTIANNTSTTIEGGGILIGSGIATLLNSTVSGNVATQSGGGGVWNNRGTVSVINSTISGNRAPQGGGGGIYNFEGTLTLINSTISGNTALHGGGMEHRIHNVNIKNTIIAGNTLVSGSLGPDLLGTFNSQDYNLIGNSSGATFTGATTHNITNVNPLLGPLGDNGGPTMTHALLSGSPAINAGSNALAVDQNGSPLTTDQRGIGFSRIASNTVDIGAFELVAAPSLMVDATNHVLGIDSVTFVREPFRVIGPHNFSSDNGTRVMIFTSNLGLTQPSSDLAVTAGGIQLTVEAVGTLAGAPEYSYIIVKLEPVLVGNVQLVVTLRGAPSNAGVLAITQ